MHFEAGSCRVMFKGKKLQIKQIKMLILNNNNNNNNNNKKRAKKNACVRTRKTSNPSSLRIVARLVQPWPKIMNL